MIQNTSDGFSKIKYSKGNVYGYACERERDGDRKGEEVRERERKRERIKWETTKEKDNVQQNIFI